MTDAEKIAASLCGILVPRFDWGMGFGPDDNRCASDCIRPQAHDGPHVFRNLNGDHVAWEDDMECGCCEPEDGARCFDYWILSHAEAEALSVRAILQREGAQT